MGIGGIIEMNENPIYAILWLYYVSIMSRLVWQEW